MCACVCPLSLSLFPSPSLFSPLSPSPSRFTGAHTSVMHHHFWHTRPALHVIGMDVLKRMGGCLLLLLVAIIFDIIGVVVLFVGIFANLRIDGQFYGDFLIYTGSLVVFLSLFLWLLWYVANIQVPDRYFNPYDKNSVVERLARSMSRKMSQKPGTVKRVKRAENGDESMKTPAHKASRVTWGRNSAFHNEGFCGDDGRGRENISVLKGDKGGRA
uniref:Transmembrane protein 238a n=1 Tax=Cynoglossus semilaevis TaxID=244447 RepID=A0A3P8X361_CYNSE